MYWPVRLATTPLRRLWFDVDVRGAEDVPRDGAVILAPNHLSFLDAPLLMTALPRKVLFLGKAEYMASWHTRMFRSIGMIPVDRGGKDLRATLDRAAGVLEGGGALGIFPEGTRARQLRIHRGHTGVAALALRTGAALIPVGIRGTEELQPPGARVPRRGTVRIRFGAPLDLGRWRATPPAIARKALTDELMQSIASLAGLPYSTHPAIQPERRISRSG
jgi:1-acyl-sn-glycerol-3-phosphate acyltransferase